MVILSKQGIAALMIGAIVSSLALASPAFAHEGNGKIKRGRGGMATTTLVRMHDDDDDEDGHGRKGRAVFSLLFGNGQPVVAGTVTSVGSTTVAITNKGGASFTIDAANANIVRGNATTTFSNVAVGDKVLVQGAVTGASIAASAILDENQDKGRGNFFGHIGKFFSRMFGFF